MTAPSEFSIHPIRRYSDEPTPTDQQTRERALRLVRMGLVAGRDGRSVRRGR